MRQEQLHIFGTDKAKTSPREDFLLKDVARATSAAPTYFSAAKIKNKSQEEHLFVDGGVIANNPAVIAFMHAKARFPQARKITLLSLGTGHSQQDNLSEIKKKGLLGWGAVIASLMMDGNSDLNHQLLSQLSQSSSPDQVLDYLRLQPMLTKKRSEMDNVSEDNLNFLTARAKTLLKENAGPFARMIESLADSYESRGYALFPVLAEDIKRQLKASPHLILQKPLSELEIFDIAQILSDYQRQNPSRPLQELRVEKDVKLTDKGIALLAPDLSSLSRLSLASNHVSEKGLEKIAHHCKHLTFLNLEGNTVTQNGLQALGSTVKNLIGLNLSQTNLSDQEISFIVFAFPILNEFYGDRNPQITAQGGEKLLKGLSYLHTLSLSRTKAAEGVIRALGKHSSLTTLELCHAQINEALAKSLSVALQEKKNLISLKLYYNRLQDEGASSLGEWLSGDTSLTDLDLNNNGIGDKGLTSLAKALTGNTTLKTLNLQRNPIEEKGFVSFCKSLQNQKGLTRLLIDLPTVDDQSSILKALGELKTHNSSLKVETRNLF